VTLGEPVQGFTCSVRMTLKPESGSIARNGSVDCQVDDPILETGWVLLSAEGRHAEHPSTFNLPDPAVRSGLTPGMAAQLLFDIETRQGGKVIDRGVDRMWVIVLRSKAGQTSRYLGVLDSDPGWAENLRLRKGDIIPFGPEHVCRVDRPPRDFLLEAYGHFFQGHI
jgi:hypothetical protein